MILFATHMKAFYKQGTVMNTTLGCRYDFLTRFIDFIYLENLHFIDADTERLSNLLKESQLLYAGI